MQYTIQLDAALPGLNALNRKQVFEALAEVLSPHISYPQKTLVELLLDKEKQSSSGTGEGVAIPHLKSPIIPRRLVALTTLHKPVEFGALDDKPADLVCILLSPESDGGLHLRGLSRISRLLKNKQLCQKLREAKDAETLRSLFLNPEGWLLAA